MSAVVIVNFQVGMDGNCLNNEKYPKRKHHRPPVDKKRNGEIMMEKAKRKEDHRPGGFRERKNSKLSVAFRSTRALLTGGAFAQCFWFLTGRPGVPCTGVAHTVTPTLPTGAIEGPCDAISSSPIVDYFSVQSPFVISIPR